MLGIIKANGISLTLREGEDQDPSSMIRQREREAHTEHVCACARSLPYPQLTGRAHQHWEEPSAFHSPLVQVLILPRIMFNQTSGPVCPSRVDT